MADTVYIAETSTGKVWGAIDGVTGSVGDGLNDQGVTGRYSIPIRPGLRSLLAQPWRATLLVADGEHIWSANPVPDIDKAPAAGRVEVNGGSIYSLLELLPAWRNVALWPPSTTADLNLRGSLSGIAVGIAQNALTWGPLPLALPGSTPGGTSVRNYPSFELNDSRSRLLNIVDDQGGRLDVHFQPRWKDGQHNYFEWEMRVGEPLGRDLATPWTWDSRSDAVVGIGEKVSGALMATDTWVGGDGQERAKVVGHASSRVLLAAGWPAMHRIDGSGHASVSRLETANGHAAADLADGQKYASQLSFSVRSDLQPTQAEWRVGDPARFVVGDDNWIPDGDYTGQIAQWSRSIGSNKVSLVLADQM